MPNTRARTGKAAEIQVIGQFLAAGLDCYMPLVDDQAIDAVLRVEHTKGARYFDVQIKSARTWNGIRGNIADLGKRQNSILILFNSSTHDLLWLDAPTIAKRFKSTGSTWGDVFLTTKIVKELQDERRGELDKLQKLLSQ